MLTQTCRPQSFAEMAGQEQVKELLKAIVKNPDTAPKTLILQGEYGTGKTTSARIFAKALNCRNKTKDGDVCGHCDICTSDIDKSIYYDEFDSAMIGNVPDIKELKETFYFDKNLGYKVITLDETHLMSSQSQATLLKVLEESNSGIFFVLCTTNVEKILPTIRSRALKLRFDLIGTQDILNNLKGIVEKNNYTISDDILGLIADRSRGHLRDAHMLLDEYLLLGEEEFRKVTQSSEELYYKLILAAMKNDIITIQKIISIMQSYPLYMLKQDYEMAVLNIIKVGLRVEQTTNKYLAFLVSLYKERIFTIIDILNRKEIYEMFTSDKRFQAAMYLIVGSVRGLSGR